MVHSWAGMRVLDQSRALCAVLGGGSGLSLLHQATPSPSLLQPSSEIGVPFRTRPEPATRQSQGKQSAPTPPYSFTPSLDFNSPHPISLSATSRAPCAFPVRPLPQPPRLRLSALRSHPLLRLINPNLTRALTTMAATEFLIFMYLFRRPSRRNTC